MVQNVNWRVVWRFLNKLKLELPYDPAIPHLGIYLEKFVIRKDTCTLMIIAALFYSSQDMEATKISLDRGKDKEDVAHTYNGMLFSHKKE